ncbi:MAG: hypothetical protein GY853_14430 [PVC group bacterium]|nr:hypothetical protein [PVC group bacterium]
MGVIVVNDKKEADYTLTTIKNIGGILVQTNIEHVKLSHENNETEKQRVQKSDRKKSSAKKSSDSRI